MFWISELGGEDAGSGLHRGNGGADRGLLANGDVVMLTVNAQGLSSEGPVFTLPHFPIPLPPSPTCHPQDPESHADVNPQGWERASLQITSCGHTPSPRPGRPGPTSFADFLSFLPPRSTWGGF